MSYRYRITPEAMTAMVAPRIPIYVNHVLLPKFPAGPGRNSPEIFLALSARAGAKEQSRIIVPGGPQLGSTFGEKDEARLGVGLGK